MIVYVKADVKQLTDRNIDLFKYNPNDVYTLPEDIDDDKPAVIYNGDVMKAKVEKLESINGNKKFKLDLKTQNGIEVTSVGKLRDDKTFVVSGSYSFTGADGKRYRTRYTADEFGYHPMTELDLDIPEPQPLIAASSSFSNTFSPLDRPSFGNTNTKDNNGLTNRYQFLNQNSDKFAIPPRRGSGQSGDDYSYNGYPSDSFSNSETNEYDSDNQYYTNGDNNKYTTDDNLNTDYINGQDNNDGTGSILTNAYQNPYGQSEQGYDNTNAYKINSGQSGQNFDTFNAYGSSGNGYEYGTPSVQFNKQPVPSRGYLPAF